MRTYVKPVLRHAAAIEAGDRTPARAPTYAAAVTTYNRPRSLARTLPQVLALGVPTPIVDDASTAENARENARIAEDRGAAMIRMPSNRGLCNSLNAGVSYWLADRGIDWISTFQDDVDVHPELLKVLERVQDAQARPLLAGRDAPEHPTFATGGGVDATPGEEFEALRVPATDRTEAWVPVPR